MIASHAVRRRARALLSTCESRGLVGARAPENPEPRSSALAMKPGVARVWGRLSGTGVPRGLRCGAFAGGQGFREPGAAWGRGPGSVSFGSGSWFRPMLDPEPRVGSRGL